MRAPPDSFYEHCRDVGIELDAAEVDRLGQYLELLLDANARFNLTAIREPDEAWLRHTFDSLTLLGPIAELAPGSIIDIGSGGGCPGIPLAIIMPDVQFTLLEATGKKAAFLQQTAETLKLTNVSVHNDRAETAGRDREHHRERYDISIARALGHVRVLAELTVPFVKVGGFVLAIKGAKAQQEIEEAKQAMHLLHAAAGEIIDTPTGRIVPIEKLRSTPKLYPRRPGEPKRAPLGGALPA